MRPRSCAVLLACVVMSAALAADEPVPTVPGITLQDLRVPSSVDGKEQPVIVGVPDKYDPAQPTPLLVGVHTWSATYMLYAKPLGTACAERNWLLVLPHFRGPNTTGNPAAREAGGSLLAQHDIVDAVRYMQGKYNVDPRRIYAMGGSGGGHMSLLMAGKYPDLWAGVSSWCPITSLREWHEQPDNGYAPHIEAVTGGKPGASPEVDFEYLRRSPRTFITNAANTNVFIGHGDKDSLIFNGQTWKTYEVLRPLQHRVEFYSWSGGHQMLNSRALDWLAAQTRPVAPPLQQHLVSDEGKWYFWAYVEPDAPLTLAQCDAIVSPATAAARNRPAAPARCQLTVAHARVVRLKLRELGLGEIRSVTCDGQPLAASAYTVADGTFELRPAAPQQTAYVLTF
ncbi:prolyl oligopeptidase family serine peptidase [bacterium]|nr:prolyl oligopeptidase family serine peptidase [bacterium]